MYLLKFNMCHSEQLKCIFFNHSSMDFETWRFADDGNLLEIPKYFSHVYSFERFVRVAWNMSRRLFRGNSLSQNQMLMKLDQSTDLWKNLDLPPKCVHILNALIVIQRVVQLLLVDQFLWPIHNHFIDWKSLKLHWPLICCAQLTVNRSTMNEGKHACFRLDNLKHF